MIHRYCTYTLVFSKWHETGKRTSQSHSCLKVLGAAASAGCSTCECTATADDGARSDVTRVTGSGEFPGVHKCLGGGVIMRQGIAIQMQLKFSLFGVHIGSMYMSIQENIGSTYFRYGGVQFNIGICTVGNISYSLGTPTCHDLSSDLSKQLAEA